MPNVSNKVFALLASAAFVSGHPLRPRDDLDCGDGLPCFREVCDAARNPTWSDCDVVWQTIYDSAGGDSSYLFEPPGDGANVHLWYYGNCVGGINFWWGESVSLELATPAFQAIREHCQNSGAGGESMLNAPDVPWSVFLYANDDNAKVKRDSSYQPSYQINNYAGAGVQYGDAQPGGSEWSMTDSETQTSSVSVSASVSADLFEIFQASMSVEASMEDSYETSTTQTIPNNCDVDQTGTLYWSPLYTLYNGGFYPDGPFDVEILIPILEGENAPAGRFDVQCSD